MLREKVKAVLDELGETAGERNATAGKGLDDGAGDGPEDGVTEGFADGTGLES